MRRPVMIGAYALVSTVSISSHAQERAAAAPAVEEVVVTGTSIRGIASAGSPSIALNHEAFVETGLATSSDLARALPQVINLGADESRLGGAQDGAANTTRVSSINLRGVGNEATLLLINGRRLAPAGVIKSLYDPNVIPAAAVERMEVVVDGASAIYGSDAVAGVVNIITRRDFSGAETFLRYGSADGTDQIVASQNFGLTWDGGSLFAAFEHYERDRLPASERAFASSDRRARGGSDARSRLASPGNIVSGTTRYPLPPGDGVGLTPADLTAGAPNLYNDTWAGDLLPKQERNTFFVDARHQFGRWDAWYQGWFSDRDFEERVAPASGQLRVPNTNPWFVAPAELGSPATVNVEYRFVAEDANPELVGDEKAYQNAVGFGVDLSADWRLEGYANFSKSNGFQRRGAITNGAALNAALASSDPATAFNPFGDGSFNVTNNPALVDVIIANRDTDATSETQDFSLKADGPLFDVPAGSVRLAVGVEHHENSFEQTLTATNVLASGAPTLKNVKNERDNLSAFAELYVPIVGSEQNISGVHSLALSLAGRYEDYSDFGETTNPKIGLTWQPIESLALRGTYGTSFRAPSLVDTSEQIHNIFIQNLTDPTAAGGVTRGIFHNGGRASLQAEEATTWSAGLDWTPRGALDGFTASLTYYDIDYTDRIDVVPNTALTQPGVYSPYIIRRPPASDAAATDAFNALVADFFANPDLQSPAEPVTNINAIIDGRRANLGSMQQTGLDVNLAYAFTTSASEWRVGLTVAKILDLTRSTAPGLPFVDVLDRFGNPVDLRARAALNWRMGGISANLYYNYTDGYRNTAITPNVEVDSYHTVDLALIYDFEGSGMLDGLSVALSGQDITDEEPPVVLNGVVSWDNQVVSPLGRFISASVTKRW